MYISEVYLLFNSSFLINTRLKETFRAFIFCYDNQLSRPDLTLLRPSFTLKICQTLHFTIDNISRKTYLLTSHLLIIKCALSVSVFRVFLKTMHLPERKETLAHVVRFRQTIQEAS